MKNFSLLFRDELNGFYKSGVMLALWVLLPLIGILIYFLVGNQMTEAAPGQEVPMTFLIGYVVSNLGAQITAIMLTVNIINEKNAKVYEIYVIRPIRRSDLLWAKFLSVFLCVMFACIIAMFTGILVDSIMGNPPSSFMIKSTFESFFMSLGIVGIFAATGIVVGVLADSILVGVLLILFVGGNLPILPALPGMFGLENSMLWSLLIGLVVTVGLMLLGSVIFKNKQF